MWAEHASLAQKEFMGGNVFIIAVRGEPFCISSTLLLSNS